MDGVIGVMQVRIKNMDLVQAQKMFYNLRLKGRESRHRTRFIKLLDERIQEFSEQEMQLLKEHCHLDEDGNPKKTEDGRYWDVKDIEAYAKDRRELYNEEFILEGADIQKTLLVVRDILDNFDEEISGEEAMVYDRLCESFKVDEEIDEDSDN